jgi:hypothetical protein
VLKGEHCYALALARAKCCEATKGIAARLMRLLHRSDMQINDLVLDKHSFSVVVVWSLNRAWHGCIIPKMPHCRKVEGCQEATGL